jgi:hypothetical protein
MAGLAPHQRQIELFTLKTGYLDEIIGLCQSVQNFEAIVVSLGGEYDPNCPNFGRYQGHHHIGALFGAFLTLKLSS